jgi:short-subunit dehydrogenase
VQFSNGIDDVISTNALSSGYWVITGANSGIGLALAKRLYLEGKKLILIDKDSDKISKFYKEKFLPKHNRADKRVIIIKADLSNKTDIYRIVDLLRHHTIRCLVNNAGIGYRKKFHDHTLEEIDKIIAVNVESHILITRLLLDKLKKEGSSIVNVASSIAYNPLPNMSMYSSTKAFISNWSESLTYELKDTNNVITFSPSGTNTNFQKNAGVKKEKDGKGLKTPEYVAEKIIEAVEKNKSVVILGLKTNVLLLASKFLPRKLNILFWGKLFEKMR